MELTENTLQVLRNFASIHQNIVIQEGNILRTVSEAKTVLARSEVDVDFPSSFGVYDLGELLSVLSLVESPRIAFDEKFLTISDGSGRSSVKYFYSDPNILTSSTKDISMPDPDVSFRLDRETMNKIKRAASVFGHTEVSVTKEDGAIILTVLNNEDPTSNTLKIMVDGSSDLNGFKLIFNINNLKMIDGDYDVSLSSKLISHFVNTESNVEYWVALQKTSKF
ncbi:DNA polymerase [bacterium]|nr:DNA polymerase [bacterium]